MMRLGAKGNKGNAQHDIGHCMSNHLYLNMCIPIIGLADMSDKALERIYTYHR
jgi:hypothetical protein